MNMESETITEKGTTMSTYLSFVLDNELFATDVKNVLEILELKPVTRVPRAPEYITGVINLRGSVLPVVDLRKIFRLGDANQKEKNIVVLTMEQKDERITLGALVDEVKEVIDVSSGDVEPAPSIGTSYRSRFIQGMLKKEEEFIMLLDVLKIFSDQELSAVKESRELSETEE